MAKFVVILGMAPLSSSRPRLKKIEARLPVFRILPIILSWLLLILKEQCLCLMLYPKRYSFFVDITVENPSMGLPYSARELRLLVTR